MTNPIGCDIHEMYTDYPLLLKRMDFIACRTGQGIYQPDAAYARHKRNIIGKRPLLAWHVQKPWQKALAQVDEFLRIQPPEDGVRHSWDCELGWRSINAVTDHLCEIMRLMLAKTGLYPIVYSGKWFIDPWIDVSALPPETKWWLAEYAENKYNWYVNRGSGGYTIVDDRLHFDLQPIAGIKPENVLIHQPTSHANGRIWGAWTAADGRLDIDFWLQGGEAGMLNWFGLGQGEQMKIKVKPEAAAWTVQVDSPGERMASTEPLDVKATDGSWYQLVSGKWVPGWHFDIVDEPTPELPKVLWKGEVLAPEGLNVRSSRDFSDNVLITLPQGMDVEVFEDDGTWARIDPSQQQWVVKRLLGVIKEGEPIPSLPGDIPVLNIPALWQRDPRWASVKLGTSNTTIAGYGCLLTDITMYTNFLLGTNYTPAEMNEIIKKVGGFVSGNLFRFAALWEAFPDKIGSDKFIRCDLVPAPLSEIDAILKDRRPVIVETRMSNHTQEHWALIIGKQNGKYVANDPWTGKRIDFENTFGEAGRWIYTIVSYKNNKG